MTARLQGLTDEQLAAYRRDGYVVLPGVLARAECEQWIEHMMDLHAGRKRLAGFEPREPGEPGEWGRTFNQHFYDLKAMALLLDARLRGPLTDCLGGEPDAVQTMYFYKGSEQRRHQDAYYLPECMAAWIPMVDVNDDNGTIRVQRGSHRRHLVTAAELNHTHGQDFSIGERYNDAVDAVFEHNARAYGLEEVAVQAGAGDVVLFHGVLIHRGGPIGRPGSFRHVMANHYIPYASTSWPYGAWPRFSFDGERRPADVQPTEALPSKVTG